MKKKQLTVVQTQALYTINKEAKKYRDRRKEVGEIVHLFLSEGESIDGLTEQEEKILNDVGLQSPVDFEFPSHVDDFKSYWQRVSEERNSDLNRELEEEIEAYGSGLLSEEDMELCWDEYGICRISMDTSFEEMSAYGITASGIEFIKDTQDEINKTCEVIERNNDVIARIKKFKNAVDDYYKTIGKRLYVMKDCVLTMVDAEPVAYHKIASFEQQAAYYVINGFKFHMFVDFDDVDDEKIDDTVNIDMISAENKLDTKMSVDEAIGILLEYLGYNKEMVNTYLEKNNPDISKELEINIVMPIPKHMGFDGYDEYEEWEDDYE